MNSDFNNSFEKRFPNFGVNKSRELIRLICEISKIKGVSELAILDSIEDSSYEKIKKSLLRQRYPQTFAKSVLNSFYLPKYEINPLLKTDTRPKPFYPENIYYEKETAQSRVYAKAKELFAHSSFCEIESLKSFSKSTGFTSADYNFRTKNLFLVKEKYDFFKRCPCTGGVVNCGYSIMNLGMGCAYECSYCFLQAYQNVCGVIIPCNIEDYLKDDKIEAFTGGFFNYKRIGSGEFTDSLIFDHISEFSKDIISFFKNKREIFFEFKTKSANIKNLLESGGQENIVAAWSVNSLKMQKENEFGAPEIAQRIECAKQCAQAGFSTAFHFDPIIFYDDWKSGYKETVDMIFDSAPNGSVKWISLGTLRMPAAQKTVMENRFPDNAILNGELLLGQDYKLRYHKDLKIEIYRYMNEIIKAKKSKCAVYLCMEEPDVWKASEII